MMSLSIALDYIIMEAERLNSLAANLADLSARSADLRGYL